jgi:hypothetical protein
MVSTVHQLCMQMEGGSAMQNSHTRTTHGRSKNVVQNLNALKPIALVPLKSGYASSAMLRTL